jgi:hypothetical protein
MNAWLGYDMPRAEQEGVGHLPSEIIFPNQLISYAEADIGVVYVVGRGFWTDDIVDRHFIELRRTAALARRNVDKVRVLVDLREASVQSPPVAARIKTETRLIWTEADRIAVVLQSTLAKLQISRLVDRGNHASFIAIEDARRWLGLRALNRLDGHEQPRRAGGGMAT